MMNHRAKRTRGPSAGAGLLLAALGTLASRAALAAPQAVGEVVNPRADVFLPGGAPLSFWILGALTVMGAVATVTRRNPVVAAVCLVGTLFCTGGLYLLLQATFMAAIQVMVYAGAIMVLFIFVIMAVDHPEREEIGLKQFLGVKLVGLAAMALIFLRLLSVFLGPDVRGPRAVPESYGDVASLGRLLFSDYLFPFEAISILLLVAIVGAVVVSRHPAKQEG